MIFNGLALFCSEGRSGYILLIMLLPMLIFIYGKNILIRVGFIILLLIGSVASIVKIDVSWDKWLSGRAQLWITAIESIRRNPVFGVGNSNLVSNLTELLPEVQSKWVYGLPGIEAGGVHNIFIQVAVVYGIPTLFIFILFLFSLLFYIANKIDKLNGCYKLKTTILSTLCFGIIGVNFFESNLVFIISFISLIFWTYMGYAVRLVEKK
ncbi:O-Antigen ligase [compost metagenome]